MIEIRQIGDLKVATLGPSCASRNALVFLGLAACIDPFELHRLALMAEEWRARLTVVDTPGHGGSRLDRGDRLGLLRGDFTTVARRIVRAASEFDPTLHHQNLTLVGYSLGTSIAAAAAADPGLVRVGHMVAVEPVAMRSRNPLRLLSLAKSEDTYVEEYALRGRSGFNNRQSAVSAARTDLALLGYGLSRGRLQRDLLKAGRLHDFCLQVVHGHQSQLSQPADVTKLVEACRKSGITVRDVALDGRHALWQSYPDVADLARQTANLLH